MMQQWHAKAHGYIGSRVWDDATADDVCCDTWTAMWLSMPIYVEAKNEHGEWVFYWANLMLRRHFSARARHSGLAEALSREVAGQPALHPFPLAYYWDLLRMTLCGDDPPHQLLAFCLRDLLGHPPREVHRKFGEVLLNQLVQVAEDDYVRAFHLPSGMVRPCFDTLRERLLVPAPRVSPARESRGDARLLTRTTGTTAIADYYTNPENPAANIGHWCGAVLRRLRSQGIVLSASGWLATVEE